MTTFSRYQQALQVLRGSRRPLFVLLKDVDADALGSATALAQALEQGGVRPVFFCASPIPDFLTFLLGSRAVLDDPAVLTLTRYDLAVVVDAGSLDRTGLERELESFRAAGQPLLNIDHHHIHQAFGTVNLIDETASATAELVYDLIKLGGWTVTPAIATAVLTGVVADTDNFTNAATSIRALTVAAECYGRGADVRGVVRALYRHQPLNALQLWGTLLARLQKNERWGIVATVIVQEDLRRHGLRDEAIEGLANFLSTIGDMRAALVLTELPDGLLKGSLRTTRDDVDVSKLAQALGGGGHRKAAGFTVPGRIVETPQGWRIA